MRIQPVRVRWGGDIEAQRQETPFCCIATLFPRLQLMSPSGPRVPRYAYTLFCWKARKRKQLCLAPDVSAQRPARVGSYPISRLHSPVRRCTLLIQSIACLHTAAPTISHRTSTLSARLRVHRRTRLAEHLVQLQLPFLSPTSRLLSHATRFCDAVHRHPVASHSSSVLLPSTHAYPCDSSPHCACSLRRS